MSTKLDKVPEQDKAPETVDRSRRNFLRAGIAGASVAAAGTGAAVMPAAATESDAEKTKARYKETDHVKTYYATNRY
jgi:anaerobic selenocysteine-containing dehydrogenase